MINLVGIPCDINSSFLKGAAEAPGRIRSVGVAGSANTWAESGLNIARDMVYRDNGDLPVQTLPPERAYQHIASAIQPMIRTGQPLVCLGGDHSITYPILTAFHREGFCPHILHFDAHADLYDDFEGNAFSHASPFARIAEEQLATSIVQVGIRTLNDHQRAQADRFGVRIFEMKHWSSIQLEDLQGPVYISLDLDVLDPAFAPGVSHHEPGGASVRDVLQLLQSIQVPVVGADLVEYNPRRDVHNVTAMVAYKLLKELMATIWRTNE